MIGCLVLAERYSTTSLMLAFLKSMLTGKLRARKTALSPALRATSIPERPLTRFIQSSG